MILTLWLVLLSLLQRLARLSRVVGMLGFCKKCMYVGAWDAVASGMIGGEY